MIQSSFFLPVTFDSCLCTVAHFNTPSLCLSDCTVTRISAPVTHHDVCEVGSYTGSAVQAYVLEICSSEPVVSSPMRGKSEQSGDGLKESEGDPTGDRLRVVVLSGPDQVLRYALRFLLGRRHSSS